MEFYPFKNSFEKYNYDNVFGLYTQNITTPRCVIVNKDGFRSSACTLSDPRIRNLLSLTSTSDGINTYLPYFNEEQKNSFIVLEKEYNEEYEKLLNKINNIKSVIQKNIDEYLVYQEKKGIEKFQKLIDIFHQYYGEERVSFSIKPENNNSKIEIIVLFPVINIISENGSKHTIYDLYVSFTFNHNFYLTCMAGTRGKMSKGELTAKYQFSHLNTGIGTWSNFCFGNTKIANLRDDLCIEFDEIKLEMFLFQFDTYLQWESITGRPFVYISSIGARNSDIKSSFIKLDIEKVAEKLISTVQFDNNLEIKNLGQLESVTKDLSSDFLVQKIEGKYFRIGGEIYENLGQLGKEVLTFKNKKIKLTLIEENSISNKVVVINPNLLKSVKSHIEEKTKKLILKELLDDE